MGSEAEREWKASSLEELTADSPITYGVVKPGEEGEIPFIRSGDISDGKIGVDQLRTITAEVSEQYGRTLLSGGELLVSLVGNPGQVARVPRNLAGANIARQVALVRIGGRADPEFIRYALSAPYCQEQLTGFTMGSVQQVINLRDLKKVEIPLPPLPEQKAIAHILGTLDDKIELNRRMNATLEGMAQALFKSWFVDFDPVIDNALAAGNPIPDELAPRAEVRREALADGTANRKAAKPFPAAFQETETMGWIPEGWEVGSLGNILQQRIERVPPSSETAAIPYVPIECISAHSLFLENAKDGVEAQSSLTKFHKGDILFGAMRPYFHKVCIAPFDGTTRTTAFVLTSKNDSDGAFGAALANEESTIEYATLHSEGSTIPYAKWKNSLERMPIILPPSELRAEYGGKVTAMLQSIPPKFYENVTLAKLRDTLLPKLISGELRITEAKQLTEEALP